MNRALPILIAVLGLLAVAGCEPDVPATTPRAYGVLLADEAHAVTDKAAGVTVVTRSEHWGDWPVVRTAETAVVERFRAQGLGVTVNAGLHAPPADVRHVVDEHGHQSPQADLFFDQTTRDRAATYLADLVSTLHPDALIVGTSTTGELGYPNSDGAWWVPASGRPAIVTRPNFWTWYRDALVETTRWLIATVRATGFTGPLELQAPGGGVKPTAFAQWLSTGADPGAQVHAGRVFDQVLPAVLDGQTNVVVVTTSIGSQTGTPVGNACAPADTTVAVTDPVIDSWSAARWVAYLVHRQGGSLWAENTGWNLPADMAMIGEQIRGCDPDVFSWAFDYQLYDGTNASIVDYGALIAANP